MSSIEIAGNLYTIKYIHDGEEIFQELQNKKPTFFTYDVETTGLHVKADRPFMGGICFDREVYLFDTTYDILRWFPKWQSCVKFVLNHNICFDLNMTANIIGEDFMRFGNYMDSMLLVRLSTETKSARRGGISLKLKSLGAKFIDPHANRYELSLKQELKVLNKERNKMKKVYLKEVGLTVKAFNEIKEEDYDSELIEVLEQWNEDYPSASYDQVSLEVLHPYLAVDVILPQLLAEKCFPIIKERKHSKVLIEESKLIPIVVRMARVGMKVDKEYLLKSKKVLTDEIDRLYKELWSIMGDEIKVGQHKRIKEYYLIKGITLAKSDSDHLSQVGDRESQLIIKLRTLDKWRSTYIDKILRDSKHDGRFYSMLQAFSTASGRFSGDSQQFPKFPLMREDNEEEELYNPRRAFLGEWVFADFSQQELRVACHYALQLGVEDFNLFRAYMPYKCFHYMTGEPYVKETSDWHEIRPEFTIEQLDKQMKEAGDKDPRNENAARKYGWSVWCTEAGEVWRPTDLHSSTAKKTLELLGLDIKEGDKEWKKWRGMAKTTNFGKLYGAMPKALVEQLKVEYEIAQALSDGYYEAFPSLKVYADKIDVAMRAKGYVSNLYGRCYYMNDSRDFYIAGNSIIQGSCASDVKSKMVRIDEYLYEVKAKTEMVLTIHDEIVFTKVEGEEHIIDHVVKNIMEDSNNLLVPLVSEVETTITSWAEKC
jgi:DNA polymerase-1